MDPSAAHNREQGSALILVLLVTAVVASATLAALVFLRPDRVYEDQRELARLRLDAVARELTSYYEENGSFPAALADLLGRGRIAALTLEDPFRKDQNFHYAITATNPDEAKVWSVGWNQRDENGTGDDVVREVSGSVAGAAANRDRFELLKRAIAARNTQGQQYGEDDLDHENEELLEDIDHEIAEATDKIDEKPDDFDEWREKALDVFKKAADKIKKSYEEHGFSEDPYHECKEKIDGIVEELGEMAEKQERWTQAYYDDHVAPKVTEARTTIAQESVSTTARTAFDGIVDDLEQFGQSMAQGSGFNTESFRSWLQNAFSSVRNDAIQAMLEAQGLVSGSTQWFLDGYATMTDAVQALGLPSSFAYDAWGTLLQIDKSGSSPVVKSAGPDRSFGTGDDLTLSW